MIGIDMRNEKRAASSLEYPKARADVMVTPDLDVPGISANACEKPIKMVWYQVIIFKLLSLLPLKSATPRIKPKNIVVEGILKADVEVDKIEVKADGNVEGDLIYRHLVIDEGGFLNSSKVVKMTDSKALKRFNSA